MRLKTLIFVNISLLFLGLLLFFSGYFIINHLPFSDFRQVIAHDVEWKFLIIIFTLILLFSFPLALIPYPKLNFIRKYLSVLAVANSCFLIIISGFFIAQLVDNHTKLIVLEQEYIQQAKKDIEQDAVICSFEVTPPPILNAQTRIQIETLYKKYGIQFSVIECGYDYYNQSKAQEKYDAYVRPYLEKRNGKNWKKEMEFKLDSLLKNH